MTKVTLAQGDVRSPVQKMKLRRPLNVTTGHRTNTGDYQFALIVHARGASEIPGALRALARRRRNLQILIVRSGDTIVAPTSALERIEVINEATIGTDAAAWNLGLARARARWVRFIRMSETESLTLPRSAHPAGDENPAAMIESTRDAIVAQDDLDPGLLLSEAIWFDRCTLLDSRIRFRPSVRAPFAPNCVLLSLLATRPELALQSFRRRATRLNMTRNLDEWRDPGIYDEGLRNGYLLPIESAVAARGGVPRWLARTILTDLARYFVLDQGAQSPTVVVDTRQAPRFHRWVGEILTRIDAAAFAELEIADEFRGALLSYKNVAVTPQPRVRQLDEPASLVLVEYLFSGALPEEAVTREGLVLTPVCSKTQALRFFDRTLVRRRFLWIGASAGDTLSMELDGVHHRLRIEPPTRRRRSWRSALIEWIAGLPPIRRRFASAWAISDRRESADDNGEHFYRWLSTNRPDINAWFVLEKSSPDRTRLAAEGFRLVSSRLGMRLLYLNSERVVSSQPAMLSAARDIQEQRAESTPSRVYLRHGVLCSDLSHWYNEERFDLIVASNARERAAMVEDDSPYAYTSRQVRLTGLTRHDRLVALRDRLPANERNFIVVMPTWRAALDRAKRGQSAAHDADAALAETAYVKNWKRLLHSVRLRDTLAASGKDLALFPHPNLAPHLAVFDLPPWVLTATKAATSFQEVFQRASMLITDYSSVAFEMAMLRRPVLYFQFDRDTFYHGVHNWRQADHFDFARDGFGPIATTDEEVVAHVEATLRRNGEVEPGFLDRMKTEMPLDDMRACERTFDEICRLQKS